MGSQRGTVRAKFNIHEIVLTPGNGGGKVTMKAVSRGERNADWAEATPAGEIVMQVNNPTGFQWFMDLLQQQREVGRYPEVFVDFSDSVDGWPGDGHPFREADVPAGHYQTGKCGACGYAKDAEYGPDKLAHPNG